MSKVTATGWTAYRTPRWAGDELGAGTLIPGGARLDPAQFLTEDGARVTLTAGAAQGATSLTVGALRNSVPAGTTLYFGTAGKLARLSATAAAGATTVAVDAIPTALANGDTATYAGTGAKKKLVLSGTLVGRTYAERDVATGLGPAVDTDDEFYILAFDVTDADNNPDCELYRPEMLVRENYLPEWATLSTAMKAKLRAVYTTVLGVS